MPPRSFQSTLPVRGATLKLSQSKQMSYISIHAPRAGSDMENVPNHTAAVNFNPRSPCGERRSHWNLAALHSYFNPRSPCGERHGSLTLHRRKNRRFQSTLPVRGATIRMREPDARSSNISIHAPRAGSDPELKLLHHIANISIHAPRAGSDINRHCAKRRFVRISIHAPRAGSDVKDYGEAMMQIDFNPRSPCGERRYDWWNGRTIESISIHAPRAGSDLLQPVLILDGVISIHAPRAGSDPNWNKPG